MVEVKNEEGVREEDRRENRGFRSSEKSNIAVENAGCDEVP